MNRAGGTVKLLLAVVAAFATVATPSAALTQPFGMCSWDTKMWAQDKMLEAGVNRYRDVVLWVHAESNDVTATSTYTYNWWTPYCGARIGARTGAKISYMITDPPGWVNAYRVSNPTLFAQKCAEFVADMLKYVDSIAPGTVENIDLGNETHVWGDAYDRDLSWYYAETLKAVYSAAKAHNPNIFVTACGVFTGNCPECIIDELYQLGCKGYMDRVSMHYYVHNFGAQRDPAYTGYWHFPTVISYMKYLTDQNNDPNTLVSVTEFGWRRELQSPYLTEQQKADYFRYVLDMSRMSGFSDIPFWYVSQSGDYPRLANPADCHSSAAIYFSTWNCSGRPTGISGDVALTGVAIDTTTYGDDLWEGYRYAFLTPAYDMVKQYGIQYPQWTRADVSTLPVIQAANADISVVNGGFESGSTTGWTGATLDSAQKKSGSYSGRHDGGGTMETQAYTVEPNRLYEVVAWIKVSANNPTNYTVNFEPTRTSYGCAYVVDTRKYPGGWKRIRGRWMPTSSPARVTFTTNGTGGSFWVDDLTITRLDLRQVSKPFLTNNAPGAPTNLKCNGQTNPTGLMTRNLTFYWTFNDADVPETQGAYQVIIARSQADINSNTPSFWDSGRVERTSMQYSTTNARVAPGTTYWWKVRTEDYLGEMGPWSAAATFATQANSSPTAPTNLRVNGQTNPTSLTDFTPDFSWTFNDTDNGDMQTARQVLVADSMANLNADNGNVWNSGKQSGSGVLTYAGTTLAAGTTYYWKVRTWDFWDWQSPWSAAGTFVMAQTPVNSSPTAPTNLRVNGQTNPSGVTGAPTLSWTFNDPDGDAQLGYQIQMATASALLAAGPYHWNPGMITSGDTSVVYTGPALAAGATYYWRVRTRDQNGATGPYSTTAQFSMFLPPPNSSPTVTLTSPVNGSTYTAPAVIALAADASDDTAVQRVEFFTGGSLLTQVSASPFAYSWTAVVPGTYTVSARAYDDQGLWAESAAVTVVVHSSPAAPPSVAPSPISIEPGEMKLIGPGNNPYFMPDAGESLRIAFKTAESGLVRVSVFDLRGRRVWTGEQTVVANVVETIPWQGTGSEGEVLPTGVYLVQVRGPGISTSKKAVIHR